MNERHMLQEEIREIKGMCGRFSCDAYAYGMLAVDFAHGPKSKMSREDLNLGWLASRQSGVPQKIKSIEGVSRTTVLDLKAQTEKVKVLSQGIKDGTVDPGERRRRGIDLSTLGPSNAGVREREERDRLLHIKEVGCTG